MPTWDTYEDIKKVLELFAESAPGNSFILVMAQTNEKGTRSVAKVAGNFDSDTAVEAIGEALEEIMEGAAAFYGMEIVDDDDGEDEPEEEGWKSSPNDLPD